MLILYVSVFSLLMAALLAAVSMYKNYRSIANIAFSVSILSIAAVVFSDAMAVNNPDAYEMWKRTAYIAESIMAPAWLLFSMTFARTDMSFSSNRLGWLLMLISPVFLVFCAIFPLSDFFYSPEFETEKILFLGNAGFLFNILLLLYSVVVVINLEVTLRNSTRANLWTVKYFILGAGGISALNIFYHSRALLYRSIDMNLLTGRSWLLLFFLLIIGFSLIRQGAMDVKISVSRNVFMKSLSLLVVGIYLLGLGITGEGMRYLGPEVGQNITVIVGFAGAVFLLFIALSEQVRRRIMVVINKNFYSQKYDYREQWLKFTRRISMKHSFEELLKAILEEFIDSVGVNSASIWLREKDKADFIFAAGVDGKRVDIVPTRELTDFLEQKQWIINVHDQQCREVVAANEEFLSIGETHLIVPLLNVDQLVGFITLSESLAGHAYAYEYEDYDLLKTLASQAVSVLLNARLSEELFEAKEMEAIGKLSTFIIHDLKNAASMLTLITQNAEEHIDNPEFQKDAIKAISHTSEKMKKIIQKLRDIPRKKKFELEEIDLVECVRAALKDMKINSDASLVINAESSVIAMFDQKEISNVIVNLVLNALEATEQKGRIVLAIGQDSGMGYVKVSDNGCGITKEFIENSLFKPFQSTKEKGLGIGLFQCKTIVEAHSGKLLVRSRVGEGTDFILSLPLA
ncbi:MAG: PEP-CTERM system histidine kinase PrsK [Nitrospira sp.]|nr:PEP-CTERM system histidine kinase PrsK [bacterium]MBL7048980.1 PEP-CTERM system histidine kinase PrsK [Nitrospira sp.]